uniref:hypothetical protein n=1 Tax=Candidatus Electronema sp. TaxID=2698783 RepID=UPI0040567387
MDAYSLLALMTKAKLIFESPDTFLSFPALSPLTYSPEQLQFNKPGGQFTAELLAMQSEFSRITNLVPRGVLAPVTHEEYLWDIYSDVLHTAQIASSTLTAEEKSRLAEAVNFLHEISPSGNRKESQQLQLYKKYRDAHIAAQEEYKNQQLTVELSGDPEKETHWRDAEEPVLRQKIAHLLDEWLRDGFKEEVERYQLIEQSYTDRQPSLVWSEWKKSFMQDIDVSTDTNQINFAATGFSPYNIFDIDNWPRFTLTQAEIDSLVEKAPVELRKIFGLNLARNDIENISFEYRSVAITRGWLQPSLFKSRCWRLPPEKELLSTGNDLASGRCPAYVAAVIFIRNAKVKYADQNSFSAMSGSTLLNINSSAPAAPPQSLTIKTGRFTVRQTWHGDFDQSREVPQGRKEEADFWFNARSANNRVLTPMNGATFAVLLGEPEMTAMVRALQERPAHEIEVTHLKPGVWVAVRTKKGVLAAFTVEAPIGPSTNELKIRYTSWQKMMDMFESEDDQGTAGRFTVRQTWHGDFDQGREVPRGQGEEADFWFNARTANDRALLPMNGAAFALLSGEPEPAAILLALQERAVHEIDVTQLRPMGWIAVRTKRGALAAFTVEAPIGPGTNELKIRYHRWQKEQQEETEQDVTILAFICKRLPLCPNPDPSLTWL